MSAPASERAWERVTGLDFLDKPLQAWRDTDGASKGRRALLALLIGVGITMTAFGSLFLQLTGPIPFKVFPDVRPVVTMGAGLFLGLQGAYGGARKRRTTIYGVLLFVVAFHLEEATVHWIGPFPGSITGTRVGLLGTGGSLLALAAAILLHIEVESERLRQDALRRGARAEGAAALAAGLRRQGAGRVLALATGVAGIGVLVVLGEQVFGNESSGGSWVLVAGGALLLALAALFARWSRGSAPDAPDAA